jgi:hypothetical protein
MLCNFFKPKLKVFVSLYVCFNLAGCATPAAWKYAEQKANESTTYSSITDVYFAALRGQDRLRLCVLARKGIEEEPSPATLIVNLEKIKSLINGGATSHKQTSLAHGSISEGSELKNKCEPELEGDERSISIVRVQVEGEELSSAIQQQSPEELTVFVLEQNDKTYFAFGSPDQDFPGLKNETFNTHAEDNASNAGYVLVPFAVVADIVIGVFILLGFTICAVGGGDCFR